MAISLPAIISEYLGASDRGDLDAVVACFTDDAVVVDEGEEVRGHAGIRQWREKVATSNEYTVEVRSAIALGTVDGLERHDVYTHLEGNFPGGRVDLTDRFGLREGRIASLEFVATDAAEG
jgi:ketosteroid isomerase-like protein